MFSTIKNHCTSLTALFSQIPEDRKTLLATLAHYIQRKKNAGLPIRLVYVCTHNSRRSHLGQIWGAVASSYFGVSGVYTYSGGTEVTALHPHIIDALRSTGFEINVVSEDQVNPVYRVHFGELLFSTCFSKLYNDPANPTTEFAAVMTCSEADENCPFIPGVELRVGTTYDDPKIADNTPLEAETYLERSNQIALETLYTFSLIN